ARCDLTEVDSDGATTIGVSVDGGASTTVLQGQAHRIVLGANASYEAEVVNSYAGGQFAVSKTVVGNGGTAFGDGPFTVAVTCTWHGQTLYDDDFTIVDGQTVTLGDVYPSGTDCAVTETDAGGATTPSAGWSLLV